MKILLISYTYYLDMEAECSDDVMKLRVKFNATFNGLVYSAGKETKLNRKIFRFGRNIPNYSTILLKMNVISI